MTDERRFQLCLACRSAVLVGEVCDHDGADLVDLSIPADRARSLEHIATVPPPGPIHITGLPKPTGPLLGLGAVALSTVVGGMVIPFAVAAAGGVGLRALQVARRERTLLSSQLGAIGVVTRGAELEAPMSGTRCVAYGVELLQRRGRGEWLVLSYGSASDLEIRLDDGRSVTIAAGSIRLGPVRWGRRISAARRRRVQQRIIDAIDPDGRDGDQLFLFDRFAERCLRLGDRVSMDSELVPGAPTSAPARGSAYRDAASALLVPRGVPHLRILGKRPARARSESA